MGQAMFSADPSMRNSNLLPVKAKGEVRLRSVVSLANRGRTWTPTFISHFVLAGCISAPDSIASKISVSSSPRKMEMMAGGASLAPRRWSLPALATDTRSRSWYSSTALITAHKKQQKLRVLLGRIPGLQQVGAGVGAQGPVVVLAAAVDARKGLFVEQADQAVALGHYLHDLHSQLVLVRRQIGAW